MTAKPLFRLAREAATGEDIVAALPDAVLVVDGAGVLRDANPAAETFFATARSQLVGQPLAGVVGDEAPLIGLASSGTQHAAYAVPVRRWRQEPVEADVHVAPLPGGGTVVVLRPCSVAQRLGGQMLRQATGRSLAGLAAVLAHEVRNPLSGIRGAAQLLEQGATAEAGELARLIVDETDRIRTLLDRVDTLGESRPVDLGPVNIHEAMEHVRRLAAAGFAKDLRLLDRYDPSLPPVLGNRDLLIQAMLNIVKNAAEAARDGGGSITFATAYQPGLRVAAPTQGARLGLPIVASITDDGPGIADALRPHLFEPFVTGRRGGRGLGLAIVARIVADLGGAIEVDSRPGWTQFGIYLAVAPRRHGVGP